jgi:DNA-binding MarR family transcriptional regulator
MTDRRLKIRELMEGMHSLRRGMHFGKLHSGKKPHITPSQWGVVMLISHKESTVKEVALSLGITSSAATQLIDGLVESGYVIRRENMEDRRRVTLALSPKTKKKIEKMREKGIERFLKFFDALDDKEFDTYMRLNKKIIQKHANSSK